MLEHPNSKTKKKKKNVRAPSDHKLLISKNIHSTEAKFLHGT